MVSLQIFGSFMPLIYWQAEAMWSSWKDDSMRSFCSYYVSGKRSSEGIPQNVTSVEIEQLCIRGKKVILNSTLVLVFKVKICSCMGRNFMFNACHVAFIAN